MEAPESVKKDQGDHLIVGTSRRPIEINEDEESSDGENSVIILDSDTEAENGGADDEDVNDEEDSDEEEEEEEDDDSEDDSDSCVDSESVNSVWSTVDEAVGEKLTTEAAEVNIIKKFEKAVVAIADKDNEKGKRIMFKLLDDPLISSYQVEDPDYETLEEPPRYARMLQVFIAVHKNLAKVDPDTEVAHLCQVLAYEPNNTAVWLDVAIKSVENGDLDFAKYAFKRCESLKESLEAHATVLYLTCDYGACLKILKTYEEETDTLNDKMKYLKYKIRSTSQYYKQLSDRIFEEDEVYADVSGLDQRKILVFDERIEELQRKTQQKRAQLVDNFEKETEELSTIFISISADQDLTTVGTIFCDLFDRIHAWSHPTDQLIEFTEWESRKDYLEVVETVSKIVDVVECVEELTEKVALEKKKRRGKKKKQEYLANWRKRLFVDKASQEIESEPNTTADEDCGDDDEVSQEEEDSPRVSELPENELAASFGLDCGDILPIRTDARRREKTPPPSDPREFIDCDLILSRLEARFSAGSHTILDLLEGTLFLLTEHTPARGALPEPMREVMREMYNRMALFNHMILRKNHVLNVSVFELDCRKATEVCVKKYLSVFHRPEDEKEYSDDSAKETEDDIDEELKRSLVLRFMWKYAHTGLKDEIKLDYLYSLEECMRAEEVVPTVGGSFATWDVALAIGELEKKKRIESVKHLWNSKNYKDLVEIIEKDMEFESISNEETLEMLTFWLQSLEKLEKHIELAELTVRSLHFYMFTAFRTEDPNELETLTVKLLERLQRLDFKKVDKETLSTIGYLVCVAMKKYRKLEKDWKSWKILYETVKQNREESNLEYIEKLDKNAEPHVMPLLEQDLLVKAHEVLGEHHCCAQKNYEFLFFIIDRFREMIDDIPTLEMIYQKDNGWLWNNVNEELSQVLFCLYGKYGKKRKTGEDHENGGRAPTGLEDARKVLSVILVQPLPLYDEKDKLLHEVVELLNSKFPYLLKIPSQKEKELEEFSQILRASNSLEDVNKGLKKCRDDVDDYTQSLVWYAMALSAYRSTAHKDTARYSELYLLTEESAHDDRLRSSAWGILAHENVHDLFQLDLHEIYEQWKWRIMPFRMAVDAQEHEPVPHFELAATIYQLASSLARFYRHLPKTDERRKDLGDVAKLRIESREQFDRSLELTKLGDDGSQPEHQWLCYFFIGKLEAKFGKWDIVKVVESFYEAACGCELAGFYYPQKVQTKKQTNFEPLEVHYQAHAAVYKYLIANENPPLEVLRKLRVLLKVMNDGHKVVKPSNSLFKINPDVYSAVYSLVDEAIRDEKKDAEEEVRKDLKEMCFKAFTLVTERFPHIKSYYRLAQMAVEKGALDLASEHIFKNVFKRKKRDDALFDNVVEISCNDINRNGSFNFHVERCIKLGVQIAQRLLDLHNVVAVLVSMVTVIVKDDEEHVSKEVWKAVIGMNLTAMEHIVMLRDNFSARSTPSPVLGEISKKTKTPHITQATLRNELWKLWNVLQKCSKPGEELIRLMKEKTESLIVYAFKSVSELKMRMTASNGDAGVKKKYNVQKKRLNFVDMTQPLLKRVADQSAEASASSSSSSINLIQSGPSKASSLAASSSGPYLPLSDSDDDIHSIANSSAASTTTCRSEARCPEACSPRPVVPKPTAPAITASQAAMMAAAVANKDTMASMAQLILAAAASSNKDEQLLAAQAMQAIQAGQISQQQANPIAQAVQSNQLVQVAKLYQQMAQAQQTVKENAAKAAQRKAAKEAEIRAANAARARQAQVFEALQAAQAAKATQVHQPTADEIFKAFQAGKVSQANAVQMAQFAEVLARAGALARPTPVRPTTSNGAGMSASSIVMPAARPTVPAPKPIRPNPIAPTTFSFQPQQKTRYPAPNQSGTSQIVNIQRPLAARPPVASASTSSLPGAAAVPVRPTAVRPAASAINAELDGSNWTNVARGNLLEFLNAIPDPAHRDRIWKQISGNK
ncbi:unnamed protein product [Caenorhabditis sp. 36 PRJEB53466]|nr:unnamed protein product [Caenorhabditis sp. 36 PRJEB53466]